MPLTGKPPRIFYGWWIVAASVTIFAVTGGVIVYGFTAIFEPIADELHWSYAQVSFAASIRGVEMGILAPLTGFLVDRWGPRRLIFSGILIIVMGLVLMSRITSLGMFYASCVLVAIGISGCAQTVLLTALSNWFRKNIGMASGIVMSGYGLAGLMVPLLVKLIDSYGWRMAIFILAVGMLILLLPLSFVFRHKPEEYGYQPDGEARSEAEVREMLTAQSIIKASSGAGKAVRTGTFWYVTFSFVLMQLVALTIVTHLMPYLSSIGIDRMVSGLAATAIPLVSIPGRLGFGWLGDRFSKKIMAMVIFSVTGLGVLLFAFISEADLWLLVLSCIVFSTGMGGIAVSRPSLIREFFGRANFGTIYGWSLGLMVVGGTIGPPIAGWAFDTWGSYHEIWLIYAGLCGLAAIIITGIRPVSQK